VAHRRDEPRRAQDFAAARPLGKQPIEQALHFQGACGQGGAKFVGQRAGHAAERCPQTDGRSRAQAGPHCAATTGSVLRSPDKDSPLQEPAIRTETQRRRRRRKSHAWARWLRRTGIALLVVAALPFLLTLVYAIPGVRPVSVPMMADIVTLQGYDRKWTPLGEIGPAVIHAVMMSEDGQFCFHQG